MWVSNLGIGFAVLFVLMVVYVIFRLWEASQSNDRLGE